MSHSSLNITPGRSSSKAQPSTGSKPGSNPPLSLAIPIHAPVVASRPTSTRCSSPRRSPVTPRTRNRRRRGQIFDGSARGSLVYSFQSVNSVNSRWWTTYQPIQSFGSAVSAPKAPAPSSKESKKTPQPLAQPLLYRMLSVPGVSTTSPSQASVVRVKSTARPPRSHRRARRRDTLKEALERGESSTHPEFGGAGATGSVEEDEEAFDVPQFAMAIAVTTDDIIHHRHAPISRYPDIHQSSLPTIRIVSPISLSVFS